MKALASIALATVAVGAAYADASTKNLSLTLGVGFPTGDTKDAGVSTSFMGGLDYSLGMLGDGSNAQSFVGLGAFFGSGDNSFKTQSFGVHYGVMFGLGDANASMPLYVKLRGGYYSTRLTSEVVETATESTTKGGFGFTAAIEWHQPSTSGNNFSIEAGYYMMPKVSGMSNNGWYAAISFPLGK